MRLSRWHISFLMILGIFGIALLFKTPLASAASLSNVTPNPSNSAPNAEVFFLRQSPFGTQESIKVRAYYPNMASGWNLERLQFIPNQDAGQPCTPKPGGPNPNDQYIKVTLKTAGNAAEIYWIPYSNICQTKAGDNQQGQVSTNRFYAFYPLPPKPALNGNSGKLQVDITIEYGPAVTGDAGGLRFQIKGSAGSLIGQLGGGQEAFPLIGTAQSVTGSSQPNIIRIPFGICQATLPNAQIGVYDADQGGFGGLYVRAQVKNVDTGQLLPLYVNAAGTYTWGGTTYNLYHNGGKIVQFGNGVDGVGDALLPDDGSGNQATAFIASPLQRNVHYELIVSFVAPSNTIDLLIPGDAYFGDHECSPPIIKEGCQNGDPACTPDTTTNDVEVTNTISAVGGFQETGTTVSFTSSARADNLPQAVVGGWSYSETAIADQVNTRTAPVQTPYNAQRDVGVANGTAQVRCALAWANYSGNRATNCNQYKCSNNTNAATCPNPLNYQFQCIGVDGAGAPLVPDGPMLRDYTNPPGCQIYQYLCKDNAGVFNQNKYRDFTGRSRTVCNNQFICPGPSNIITYDPGYPQVVCMIFRCAVQSDFAGGTWFDPENDDDPATRCLARCNSGSGARPFWRDPTRAPYIKADYRCYIQPTFTLTCNWLNSAAQPIAPPETYTISPDGENTSQTICVHDLSNPITVTGTGIGTKVCASIGTTRSGWTNTPGWGLFDYKSFPPGGVQPWQYTIWGINMPGRVSDCVNMGGYPYFKVYGSDVRVGGGIGTTAACQTNTAANILAWNQGTAPAYSGAGTQYAAMATGFITGFVSGQYSGINGNPSPTAGGGGYSAPGNALSFANTGANFGPTAAPGCVDYVPAGMSPTVFTGTLNPIPVVAGTVTTQYIKGDVFINGPIAYSPGVGVLGLTGYRLVVDGNIYIGKGVLRLDGTYVALNNSDPNKGYIYTCADGIGSEAQVTLSGCQNQLVINGALVASHIQLLRDCGSLTYSPGDSGTYDTGVAGDQEHCSGSNHAAEIFNYSPELWLTAGRTVTVSGGTDSMRSLAPVL